MLSSGQCPSAVYADPQQTAICASPNRAEYINEGSRRTGGVDCGPPAGRGRLPGRRPQHRLNDAGVVATAEGLRQFDTDGSPITVGQLNSRARARSKRITRRLTASACARHVYQKHRAGRLAARWIGTPGSSSVPHPGSPSHLRAPSSVRPGSRSTSRKTTVTVSRCLIQDVADAVATVAMAREENWATPFRGSRSLPPRWR
jgi:hypothetical protein